MVILYDEDGKTKAIFRVSVVGSDQEPWNPTRAEVHPTVVNGTLKAYRMGKAQLEQIDMDNGNLVVLPDKPVPPKVPPSVKVSTSRTVPNHVAVVSTDNPYTGIYTYTKYLSDALGEIFPVRTLKAVPEIKPTSLLHVQHEFGIFPYVDELVGGRARNVYSVATLHTAIDEPGPLLEHYYRLDQVYDAFVVHTNLSKQFVKVYVKGRVEVIPHGSYIFDPAPRDQARRLLGLPVDRKMVFAFGFSSDSKGYAGILEVAEKMPGTLFVVSAARHGIVGDVSDRVLADVNGKMKNVRFLGKFLNEDEVNLYASAADALLYNYYTPSFIASASGALHRLLAAGKPIVGTAHDNRLKDIEDGVHAVKYDKGDLPGMQYAIELVLNDADLARVLGENARKLALETSWANVARKHMKLYADVVGDIFGPGWYDEEYFVGERGGKEYVTPTGEQRHWSYFNQTGEWQGAEEVMKGIRDVFVPGNMLSVGEGRGTFVAYARKLGIDALGVDFSEWAVANPYPDARGYLRLGDVRDLAGFEDGSYDMVFASDVMEHIYVEELDKAISEVQRVARRWIFYNNGGLTKEHEEPMIIHRGEFAPRDRQETALAGHVTVQHCQWWREKLVNDKWKARDDLAADFRRRVDAVSPEILANWHCIIVTERVS